MRNVTITREKSGVACFGIMKVYIEDPISGNLPIKMRVKDDATGLPVTKKVMCRKLGTLKNGETATFSIGWGAAKIVVIMDKLSRNYANEYYQIPAGEEDVYLSGKNRYAPGQGNPFRFNGVTDGMALENRKRGQKIGAIVLCLSIVLGFALGFASAFMEEALPQTFSDEGISITLTDAFEEVEFDDFTVCYASRNVVVLTEEEKFSLAPGMSALSLNQYAHAAMNSVEVASEVKTENGLTYFEYDGNDTGTGAVYHYYVFAYKETDAFWIVQFGMERGKKDEYRDQVFEWAASVRFD